ncbi:MAG: 16S rRNA (uracil(1498)-N(3))-methyltransferase [Candidatus Nanopelagicales bacterium]
MTPPLLFVDDLAQVVVGDVIDLPAEEARHAAASLRMKTGEAVLVADGRGHRVLGRADVQGNCVAVDVDAIEFVPQPAAHFTVVQALAKGEHGELAIDLMTQVGVDRVIPWASQRSIVQWKGERADKSLLKWRNTARAAAKQSRRAWVPKIDEAISTGELVHLIPGFDAAFILHEEAVASLAAVPLPTQGRFCLIVGPEGGISAQEIELCLSGGAAPVTVGAQVLRASLAGAIGVSVLSTRLRWAEPGSPSMG